MALTINNSISSLNANRHLQKHTNALGKTFARLASGLRINTSRDDAAGMAIGNRMVAQIRGMNQAIRNTNDGISLTQVAEGALDETTNALQRMRELAIQSANSTNSSTDRTNLSNEFQEMIREIDRISKDTEFNNVKLLGGSANLQSVDSFVGNFHIGADKDQTLGVTINEANLNDLGLVSFVGLDQGGGAIAVNGGAFVTLDSAAFTYSTNTESTWTGLNVSITTAEGANAALARIDSALDSVSDIRATLGASQSRFETIIASLSNVVENTDAARSRIMDADIAVETANLTKNTILQQAGVAILAQANQQPTIALSLLR